MIVDAHTHAWALWPYAPPAPDATTRGSADHLLYEMDLNGVDQSVVISACIDRNPGNNAYGADAASRHSGRLHHFPDIESVWLSEHHTPGAAGRLARIADTWPIRGFTHYVGVANDGWFLSEEGQAFFEAASDRRLIASLAVNPAWAADVGTLAAAFPELTILLHHLGGVDGADVRASFDAVKALAAYPNVNIKFSGFHYAARRGWDFPHRDVLWIGEALYQAFGPHRLCWGSDFPALSRFMTYRQSLELVRSHCPFIAPCDLSMILGGSMAGLLARAGQRRARAS